MSLEKAVRNTLRVVVTQSRKLLEEAIGELLQGHFGIHTSGKIEDAGSMNHLSAEDHQYREQILTHLQHIKASGFKLNDAVMQLIREVAFTHLNRLCAYKMMETRGLIKESISRGPKSRGFMFYLADHPTDEQLWSSGKQDIAYRHFLEWLGGTLSEEIGVLFSPHDSASRLFPPYRVLEQVLDLLNSEELKEIWGEDETIGWVYQYFTSKDLRDQARKESQAPRNSYELAFRNQFYPPRYVVQFLTENTLGRIWYEMCQGKTQLKEQCSYLVRRPDEVFFAKADTPEVAEAQRWLQGEDVPEPDPVSLAYTVNAYIRHDAFTEATNLWIEQRLSYLTEESVKELKTQELLDLLFLWHRYDRFSEGTLDTRTHEINLIVNALRERVRLSDRDNRTQEELLRAPFFVPYREKKDSRELRILDPACGSGHFLLYCFDLLSTIYEEAYDYPDLGPVLQRDYPTPADLKKALPALILAHNLHGIDIDLRATQIAALALWLRAQRAYQELKLNIVERPRITRSNIVCAEPMPGEKDMLDEFIRTLQPAMLGDMVCVIFEKMQLASEAGSLLKIEEEIREAVLEARQRWMLLLRPGQLALWSGDLRPERVKLLEETGITNRDFWNGAEARVIDALHQYAQAVSNGKELARQLFADDVVQGFAFIDICQKRFDVVLMNPPFGSPTSSTAHLLPPDSAFNLYSAFVLNAMRNCQGFIGAITDRSFLVQDTFKGYRQILFSQCSLEFLIDLGWGVLDTADVQVAAYTIRVGYTTLHSFLDSRDIEEKADKIKVNINHITKWAVLTSHQLSQLPNGVFAYSLYPSVLKLLNSSKKLADIAILPRGLGSNKAARTYRVWYEVPFGSIGVHGRYRSLCNGGEFSPFYREDAGVADWMRSDGYPLVEQGYEDGFVAYDQKNIEHYFLAGLSFPKQSTNFNVAILPEDAIPTREGKAIIPYDPENRWFLLGYLNSSLVRHFINVTTGLHKQSGSVGMIPIISPSLSTYQSICTLSRNLAYYLYESLTFDESSRLFIAPLLEKIEMKTMPEPLLNAYQKIDDLIADELKFDLTTRQYFREENLQPAPLYIPSISDIPSYALGCVYGRWDVRVACNESLRPRLLSPFDSLPICPPGTLVGSDGFPTTSECIASEEWLSSRPNINTTPEEGKVKQPTIPDTLYPINIRWEGILVDDPDHSEDIVRRVQNVFKVIWQEKAEVMEQEACQILGLKDLREYFRRPGNGGFWMDHVSRYSKSRRKAPIYWLLQSAKKNYALWLYYHRLDKDTLFKALTHCVEPKLRLEEGRLGQFRTQLVGAGSTGREVKQLEKQLERQENLMAELYDFLDKLRRAADLNLEPDLNDGVVLNIAPLWELVPWNEARKYWEELKAGKYEWSSISKQLRERKVI